MSWIEVGGQKRRIEIPLHRPDATFTLVNPLREGFFDQPPAAVTILRQFGTACGDFVQGAARACNGASQHLYKHPWSAKPDTFAVAFLPCLVGNLFEENPVAHCHDLVDLFAMQALSVGRQLAFFGRLPVPGLLVAPARFPVELLLALLLDAALCIEVVGIGRAPLPIHIALEPPQFFLIRCQFFAEDREAGFCVVGNERDGGRPQICADDIPADPVLGLVVGYAFQCELHQVAKALCIGPLCLWAAGLAPDEPRIFDALIQSVLDQRVVPVDAGGEPIVLPDHVAVIALFWFVQYET